MPNIPFHLPPTLDKVRAADFLTAVYLLAREHGYHMTREVTPTDAHLPGLIVGFLQSDQPEAMRTQALVRAQIEEDVGRMNVPTEK